MACFGFSGEVSTKHVPQDIEEDLVKTSSLTKKKKKNPWISWSRLRPKKSAAKTVPVDISMSGSLDPISQSHSFKLDKKNSVPSKKHRHHIGVNANNKTYKKKLGTVNEINLESREINHLNSLAKDDKHEMKVSSRKKETKKNGSVPEKTNPTATNRADPTSLPPQRQKKPKATTRENGNNIVSVKNQSKEALDSIVGMSVIIVILVLMLFLGKLCAILCTSACFYMIPRLRTTMNSNVIVNNGPDSDNVTDLNSDEHKKKVVLEGLLQRNRRSVIGIL